MADEAKIGTDRFVALSADDAKKLVDDSLPEEAAVSQKFIEGDHWQDEKGWVGPVPDLDDPDYGTTVELIKTSFTSRNVIKEIVMRHMRGVVGMEPVFGLVPRLALPPGERLDDSQEQDRRDLEDALTEWWDSRTAHVVMQKAVSDAQWAQRGVLRLFIPRGKVNGGTIPKMPDIRSALSLIFVESPDPLSAAVIVDEDTQDRCGILITDVDGESRTEMIFLEKENGVTASTDITKARQTVFRTIAGDDDKNFPLQLGGRITMYAIERSLLVTQQQHEMQRTLNLCLSMIPRNVVTGGFLERIILNALPPGHWETDTNGKKIRFIRETWQTGAGTTQWVRGIELPQKDGSVALTTPSVTMRDPVDTKPAEDAKRGIYRDMLEEADQSHVLVTGEAIASGASRREGRTDFAASLTETEAPTNGAGRWLVETVLAIAELLMGQPGSILTKWRGQFEARVNAGPVSVEERGQIVAERAAGLLSEETAMESIGVLDTSAERARRLAEDGGVNLPLLRRQLEVVGLATAAGAFIEQAAALVGMTPEQVKQITPTDAGGGGDPDADPNTDPLPDDGGDGGDIVPPQE